MNTYTKYCPNVFVAKCTEQYEKGEIITIETKYGKEIENEVHNFMGKSRDGFFLYSITRVDGFNSQERAAKKSEKLVGYAANSEKRSDQYYQASQEGRDFLILAEPIKIGHHSERRHRKLIENNWNRMGKSIAEGEKAKEYERRAEYWAERASKIDLSMPDCLEFFEFELEKAKKKHQFLLDNPDKRPHSMSLQYSNKSVKELQDKVNTAIKLWGTDEEIAFLNQEKVDEANNKVAKSDKVKAIIEKHHGFFAFTQDLFKEECDKLKEAGILELGEKLTHIKAGLYVPSKFVESFLKEWRKS
jgi:hypothetical protein